MLQGRSLLAGTWATPCLTPVPLLSLLGVVSNDLPIIKLGADDYLRLGIDSPLNALSFSLSFC